ncbi:MAG TPA: hypothetical protein VNO30_39605 [Kofleriaceae bacterium]|nr:hypothetical protein [Kofleriaceae bacterium]
MTRKPKSPSPTRLTIAIEGEGLAPKDIRVRDLIELLEATASTFDALAAEKQLDKPSLSLAKITNGSARLELVSEDRAAPRLVDAFWSVVKSRGKGATPRTRRALGRLHRAAARTGGAALRIDPVNDKRGAKPLYLTAPVEEEQAKIEEATLVFARVVGVNIDVQEQGSITLRYDDGGSGEFGADLEILMRAAALIGHPVEANVTFAKGEEVRHPLNIEGIKKRKPQSSLVAAFEEARREMTAKGIVYDSTALIAADQEDEEGGVVETDRG